MRRSEHRPYTACLILALVFFTGAAPLWSAPDFFSEGSAEDLAEELVEQMDDTELLGQVFLLGYFGRQPSREILEWIREKKIGGVKIFGWNAENLQELGRSIGRMQREALTTRLKVPLFIATDQEGGWVRHVKGDTSITPGNIAIGASGVPFDAYYTGRYIGEELRLLGINMNFAPTVDVYTNKDAHVIGPRSFSEDPLTTANLALAYYHGMQETGIICTAKHFPGHGNATEDSHGTLPQIFTSFETLWERDLLPYRFLIRDDLPAIMSAHLAFPDILDETVPASLSPYFLKEVVREKLGFEGIMITDDMRMNGVLHNGNGISESCLQAMRAGNNMIMISHDHVIHQKVWDTLYREMQVDEAFRDSIRQSAFRILKVKIEYLKGESAVPLFPDTARISREIPNPESTSFFFDQACRSVSLIGGAQIPLGGEGEGVLLVSQLNTFLQVGKQFYPEADTYYYPYTPFYHAEEEYISDLLRKSDNYPTMIFCLANPNSAEVLKELSAAGIEAIVISVLTPVYLRDLPEIETAIAVYGTGPDSFTAGFAALKGMIPAEGAVPIQIAEE
ncbi:MAG: glycoside hydrolase family 3 protein [Spirochaetota bacterium]|nr:glycoside hydrolase family 3 protein [Spirochaetota bacterium]